MTALDDDGLISTARAVVENDARAVRMALDAIDAGFVRAARRIVACTGKLLVTGSGTSGVIARRAAHLFSVGGTPAFFLSPTDGLHGGLGVLQRDDLLVAVSKGGSSDELNAFCRIAKSLCSGFVAITAAPDSAFATMADDVIRLAFDDTLDLGGMLATGSSLATAALFDALVEIGRVARGVGWDTVLAVHPSGAVGRTRLADPAPRPTTTPRGPVPGPATRDLVAGIDSSTQSCTVVLRRLDDGQVVAEARAPHPPTTPPLSEQDPRAWWQALQTCCATLQDALPRIAALSVGGQGHGLVLLDHADEPLRPAKLWNDTQAAPDAAHLLTLLPAEAWVQRTGSVPGPAMTIAKLAWTERVLPGLLARAARIMLPADYLAYRLTGRAVADRGGASGTGYFDPFHDRWDLPLAELAAAGAPLDWPSLVPEILPASVPAGTVDARAGLPDLVGAVVAVGTGDNQAAALGLAIRPGDTVISVGTSGTIYGIAEHGVRDATGAINGYAHIPHGFLPMVTTLNAAKVTDAFRRWLDVGVDAFDDLVLSAPPGCDGVVLAAYLDGERTPNRPDASGLLRGLRPTTSRACLARAAVEGVLCGLLAGGDLLSRHGVRNDGRLILTGGAARSRGYRQVLADLTGRTVWVSPLTETAAAGAAVQAAAALTGTAIDDIAARWAPALQMAAEPIPSAHAAAPAIRAAYRDAVAHV